MLVAFANVLIADGEVGWPTGVALVISSVYAALTVRREDDTVAIIVPPVAFLVAALTAGQLFIGSAEGSLLNRAVVAFFTLADNWIWIIGATAAAAGDRARATTSRLARRLLDRDRTPGPRPPSP